MSEFVEFMSGVGELIRAKPRGFLIALIVWLLISFVSGFMTEMTKWWWRQ